MRQALRKRLKEGASVQPIAGSRVDWGKSPQGTTANPRVVLSVISDPRPQHLKGFDSMRETRVQARCFGDDEASAVALAEAVIADAVDPATVENIVFGRAGVEGPIDLSEQRETEFVHCQSVDLLVRHRAA